MAQVTLGKVTADRRPLLRALRPLLVLGGFAALWWILMTGSAQAASGPDHDELRDTLRSAVQTVHRAAPVTKSHAVRRVTRETTTTTSHVVHAVRRTTEPVAQPVTSVVAQTPVAPVVDQAKTSIRETVDAVVDVVPAAAAPVTEPVVEPLHPSIASIESSTVTGETPSKRFDAAGAISTPRGAAAILPTDAFQAPGTSLDGQSRTLQHLRVSPSSQAPAQAPFDTPSSSERCPSSSASGSATPTPAGFHELSFLVGPSLGADRHLGRVALRSGGPSHLPGCSPD